MGSAFSRAVAARNGRGAAAKAFETERECTTVSLEDIEELLSSVEKGSKRELIEKKVVPMVLSVADELKKNCLPIEELAGKFQANAQEDVEKLKQTWETARKKMRARDFRDGSSTTVAWYLVIHLHAYHLNSKEKKEYRISMKGMKMVAKCLAVGAVNIAGAATGIPLLNIAGIVVGLGAKLAGDPDGSTAVDARLYEFENAIAEEASRHSNHTMKVWLIILMQEFHAKAKMLEHALAKHSYSQKIPFFPKRLLRFGKEVHRQRNRISDVENQLPPQRPDPQTDFNLRGAVCGVLSVFVILLLLAWLEDRMLKSKPGASDLNHGHYSS